MYSLTIRIRIVWAEPRKQEEKERRGGRTEGRGSTMTTKGGKPGERDAAAGVEESDGGEKKGESSRKVTST